MTSSRVTPHRTADRPRVAPTPMIDAEIVCVVLSGMPSRDASSIVLAAAISAAKPWCVSSFVIRIPSVRMMRHPPVIVPSAMTAAQRKMTHFGIANVDSCPPSTSASVKAPMNF